MTRTARYAAPQVERVAIYCRISLDPRMKEMGVKRQEKDCRGLAGAREWPVDPALVFVDNDIAVLREGAERPGYRKLCAAIRRGEVSRVMAHSLSRLVRNRRERADLIELCRQHGVSLTLLHGSDMDLTSAAGRMVVGVIGEADTMESEVKSERVADAALDRAERGYQNAHVAYGWQRMRTRNGIGEVIDWHDVEDPETAAIVREIVDRLLDRESIKAIVADLNERKILPPRSHLKLVNGHEVTADDLAQKWLPSTVRKIAMRLANIGRISRDRQDFGPALAPAIVDHEKHDQVVALLTDPSRATSNSGARKHLLSFGIGECGVCGGPLRAKTTYRDRARTKGKEGNEYTAYHCRAGSGCVGRAAAPIDQLVEDVVVARLARPDARDLLVRDDGDAAAARKEMAKAAAKLDELQDDYDAELISREMYLRGAKRWRAALNEATEASTRAVQGMAPGRVAKLAGPHAREQWHAMDVGQRRALLDALGVRVAILKSTKRGPGFDHRFIRITFRDEALAEAA